MVLANYITAAALMWILLVVGGVAFTRHLSDLSKNSRLASSGLLMVPAHWAIHQSWWGVWWFSNKFGTGEAASWLEQNAGWLAFSYWIMFLGAATTTAALLRGHFVRNFSTKVAAIGTLWLCIVVLTTQLPGG